MTMHNAAPVEGVIVPARTAELATVGATAADRLAILRAAWLASFDADTSTNTRDAYGLDLDQFAAWCADPDKPVPDDFAALLESRVVDPVEARRVHIDLWSAYMRDRHGWAPATRARKLSALASFFAYVAGEGVRDGSPVAHVRRPKVSTSTTTLGLSRQQARDMIEQAGNYPHGPELRASALVAIGFTLLLRISEIIAIDIEDITEAQGHRVVPITGKGGEVENVVIPPETWHVVALYIADRKTGPLFVTSTGKRWDRHEALRTLRVIARMAGIEQWEKVTPHVMRHTGVTGALLGGASLRKAQQLARHKDPRTTERYAHDLDQLTGSAAYVTGAYFLGDGT
ncbi:MAG TPA: tyrosine-type recombinase/integrase [Streptosporangiaceae bacterium]|jgi:site-specific recombinase XerD